jgi:hypothetical protein
LNDVLRQQEIAKLRHAIEIAAIKRTDKERADDRKHKEDEVDPGT